LGRIKFFAKADYLTSKKKIFTLKIAMNRKTTSKFSLFFLVLLSFLLITNDVLANWVITSDGTLLFGSLQILGRKTEKTTPPGLEKTGGIPPGRQPKIIHLEPKGNQLQITLEDEEGEEIETPEGTESAEIEIEEPEDKTTVKVRSLKNSYAVIRDKIAAQTHFPLMVNLETNELIVTTPAGQKTVTILPDQAVENMLAANVIDQLGGKGGLLWLEYQASLATPSASPSPEATESASPTPEATEPATPSPELTPSPTATGTPTPEVPPVEEMISLTTTDEGVLAYEIQGIKYEKFFGFIKVMLKRKVIVSAETGELLGIEQDLFTRILDLFSV